MPLGVGGRVGVGVLLRVGVGVLLRVGVGVLLRVGVGVLLRVGVGVLRVGVLLGVLERPLLEAGRGVTLSLRNWMRSAFFNLDQFFRLLVLAISFNWATVIDSKSILILFIIFISCFSCLVV